MTTATLDSGPQLRLPMPARCAMAACGVLAPVLMIVALHLHPVGVGVGDTEALPELAANLDGYLLPSWLDGIGAFLWVPALLMAGRVARTGAPTLGLVGLVLAFGLAIRIGPGLTDVAYLGLSSGLDVDATDALAKTTSELPTAVLGESWLIGLVGLVVLGVAIVRGKSAPVWGGVALIVAPVAVPVSWISGSVIAVTAAWAVLAIGFAGCALAFLSQPAPSHGTRR